MSLYSIVRRKLVTFCGSGLYRKENDFAMIGKTFGRKVTQRFLRTNVDIQKAYVMTQAWMATKDETREMMALWPDVVRDLTDAGRHLDIPDATKWLAKVLQYNVPSGKKIRAFTMVFSYRMLAPPEQLTEENIRLARILGWCIELLQAFFLIIDDIQDKSVTRRNQPCWYLHNDIGLGAINDALMVNNCIYQLFRMHLKGKDCYLDIMELMQDTTMKTVMGQCIDLLSYNFGKNLNLNQFTMDRYNSIVKYKTAEYTFVLPVKMSMFLAGIKDPEMHRQAKTILLEMGHFYQVQNDYLDCYGDTDITGKLGTDIGEGKCTWLIVVALQRATPEQKKILEECYGSEDPEKVKQVKRLYNEIGIPNTYSIYEEETYNLLNTHIQQISRGLPHDLFLKLLKTMYRRVY